MPRLALIGDYDEAVTAHRAIPHALDRSEALLDVTLSPTWIHTSTLREPMAEALEDFRAIWVVPASPYANAEGVFAAIRYAREHDIPFLGTCGGFQHAVIEYARNVRGLANAEHAETAPDAAMPVIAKLSCSLVEKTGRVHFAVDSKLRDIYGLDTASEGYHCNYGVNPQFETLLTGDLRVAARDDAGEVRAVELKTHRFFIATLFQPERAGLRSEAHPLVTAFVKSFAH
jgi:CTP synthase (UTP-ammonia lyase)